MRSLYFSVFLAAGAAFAQTDRGTITGTISDSTGAVVANAALEAKNLETGIAYQGATSTTGNYTLAQLPAGVYELSVTVPGFKKYTRQGLTVQVAQTLRIDISLEVGAATESITVQADAPLLKTESGELSHNVATSTMNALPILGIGTSQAGSTGVRNPNAALVLIPGTYYAGNNQVRINGTPSNTQGIRIEGMDATNSNNPNITGGTQPSVDAIQEMAIQTSNYAPEYGQVGGGMFNITMKSGTNQFHGSGYDYLVNEAFNAGTPFTDAGTLTPTKIGQHIRNTQRRNDFGFTLGGPIRIPKVYNGENRTFFFFNFEQYRESRQISNGLMSVPTQAYRNGDFSSSGCFNFVSGACASGPTALTLGGAPATDPAGQ